MFQIIAKEFNYGGIPVRLETGRIARQAHGSVLVTMGDVVVLTTVTASKNPSSAGFFPLTVNYIEKTYAVGKLPGGFFKREARPSEKETLTSRLIDRPLRPLFPKGFMHEVQVVCTLLSSGKSTDPDVAAMIGASSALAISGIPFDGPIGCARVGFDADENFILNPEYDTLEDSRLDMVVAGTKDAVLMVESEAKELPEEKMLAAVMFAHLQMQEVIKNIESFAAEAGKPRWDWQAPEINADLLARIEANYADAIADAYTLTDKAIRYERLSQLKTEVLEAQSEEDANEVIALFSKLEKSIVRGRILRDEPRIDGRDTKTVRPIEIELGILPHVHGSALFTRGETQAIVTATLAPISQAQFIDALEKDYRDRFLFHYNFPPYSVGEVGFLGSPKRREIGHGRLARRAVENVVPMGDDFPYTLRLVSEITESNGSSSMASVCGSSLALMDAGIHINAHVAGVAMGLVLEGDQYKVITDILGDEDHLGDMDFKVAGTANGVTALQMDIKISGITRGIMEAALAQASDARKHILSIMEQAIESPRSEFSSHAPVMRTIKINTDKIRDVIGKGGAVIKQIIEESGAEVDVNDDGMVRIYGSSQESAQAAYDRVYAIVEEPEIGKVYKGEVRTILDFGAFVQILPGRDGLVHVSQIADEKVENVRDYLKEGDQVDVLLLDIDNKGRLKLSIKELNKKV